MKTLSPQEDQYRLTIHELSHWIVCSHYNIAASPKVFGPGEALPKSADGLTILGECLLARPGTKFQDAAIGWAGTIGEILVGVSSFDICFKLEQTTAKAWFRVVMCNLAELSYTDRAMIVGYSRSHWRSFRSAYNILRRSKRLLLRLAKHAKPAPPIAPPPPVPAEPLQPVPLPDKFPASKLDFIRLIIEPTGKPGHETFNRFVNSIYPGLYDVRAATALFEQAAATRDGWEQVVRDFCRWERANS